jgi:hypothetical protein
MIVPSTEDVALPLQFYWLYSSILGRMQGVWVGMPPKHRQQNSLTFSWLLLLDGALWQAHKLLAHRSTDSSSACHSSIVVCVDGPKAPCCPLFVSYVQRELIPWLQNICGKTTLKEPAFIGGSSTSATTALYVALKLPTVFSTAIAINPALAWHPSHEDHPEWLLRRYSSLPTLPLQIALYVAKNVDEIDEVTSTAIDNFCSFLHLKKYQFSYQIQQKKDSCKFWCDFIEASLISL